MSFDDLQLNEIREGETEYFYYFQIVLKKFIT